MPPASNATPSVFGLTWLLKMSSPSVSGEILSYLEPERCESQCVRKDNQLCAFLLCCHSFPPIQPMELMLKLSPPSAGVQVGVYAHNWPSALVKMRICRNQLMNMTASLEPISRRQNKSNEFALRRLRESSLDTLLKVIWLSGSKARVWLTDSGRPRRQELCFPSVLSLQLHERPARNRS